MKICTKAYSKARHYLFTLGTGNKNDSYTGVYVTNATGEVCFVKSQADGRGFIVINVTFMKKPKHLAYDHRKILNVRLYTT